MYFDFESFPAPVALADGNGMWTVDGKAYKGLAEIRAIAQPRAGIHLVVRFKGLDDLQKISLLLDGDDFQTLSFNDQDIPGFQLSVETDGDDVLLHWCPNILPLTLVPIDRPKISRLIFHIFSFFNIHRMWNDRLILEDDDWVVTLQQVDNIAEIERKIHRGDTCRLTHTGGMERKDRAEFEGDEVAEELQVLRYFMTFVRGAWCGPVCNIGLDQNGARVLQTFSAPHATSAAIGSWFDYMYPEQMTTLFPSFSKKWKSSPEWASCLRDAVYWYTNANTVGGVPSIDTSILVAQAALERLSFQYCVVDRKLISAERFKSPKVRASDKLRMLLTSLHIPVEIPASLTEISAVASTMAWVDGPHAFSDIRNSLVHPDAKGRRERLRCISDGWRLGLWYLELALLAVCAYNGTYGSRLQMRTYGQVSPVPWKNEPWLT